MTNPENLHTFNLANSDDLARWERIHTPRSGDRLSDCFRRQFAEIERGWRLDSAVLDRYRVDLEATLARLDELEHAAGGIAPALQDPWVRVQEIAAARVLERAAIAPVVQVGAAALKARAAGGKARHRAAPEWHARAVELAGQLRAAGIADRDLAGIISRRLHKSGDAVRIALNRAGIRGQK